MALDCIGREIGVDDYVFSNNYIYQVSKIVRTYTDGRAILRAKLADPSPTTKPRELYSYQCCLITKEDYLLWMLTK